MKVSFALVLCLVVAVAMAAKPDRVARKEARQQKKLARQAEKERCAPAVSWTSCDMGKMEQRITPTTEQNCKSKFTKPETLTLDCVMVQTKEKNGCTFTRTADLTQCGQQALTYTSTLTSNNCADKVPAKKASKEHPCSRPVKMGGDKAGKRGGRKPNKKNNNKKTGNKKRGNKKMRN